MYVILSHQVSGGCEWQPQDTDTAPAPPHLAPKNYFLLTQDPDTACVPFYASLTLFNGGDHSFPCNHIVSA